MDTAGTGPTVFKHSAEVTGAPSLPERGTVAMARCDASPMVVRVAYSRGGETHPRQQLRQPSRRPVIARLQAMVSLCDCMKAAAGCAVPVPSEWQHAGCTQRTVLLQSAFEAANFNNYLELRMRLPAVSPGLRPCLLEFSS